MFILSRRIVSVLCGLALGVTCPAVAVAAERQPVTVSEDAADVTPTLEPDATIDRPKTYAIAQDSGTLYAGGAFNAVKDVAGTTYERHNMVAFDADTGELREMDTNLNGTVWAVEAWGSSLYVGGSFTQADGIARRGLVKLDATTGAVDPSFDAHISRGRVTEIQQVDGRLLIGGNFAQRLLAVDPATGRDTGYLDVPIEGSVSGSDAVPTEVFRFAVNSRQTRLVAVGNFTTVDGQSRRRAFMLDLRANGAVVDPWYYQPLNKRCRSANPVKLAYLEDVDFAPRGRWFVLVATGYVPRFAAQIGTSVCDAAARFQVKVKAPTEPTWINYTGGDTLHSVAVTGAAVYVQGHNRWLDNPEGTDSPGPGAVTRRGLGAIDPLTGKALAWNPDKPAVQGGYAFLATATGLWVGSDSPNVGAEYHRGLAYLPLPLPLP